MAKQSDAKPFIVPVIKKSWFRNDDGTLPDDEEWERILRVMFAHMGVTL